MLSVIAPAMNEQDNIARLCEAIKNVMEGANIPYELIIVDDGSRDTTWQIVCDEAEKDERVRGISFSRNFGKESAIFAGLSEARGACAAIIDSDLQFPPETLCQMYKKWQSGDFEIVEGRKNARQKETLTYKLFSKTFYKLLKAMSGIDLDNMCDFKLMDRCIVDDLNALPEKQTFFRALSDWPGYRKTTVPFDVADRNSGTSKFTPVKLVKLALGAISSFSAAPLQLVTGCGVGAFILSAILCIFTVCFPFAQHGNELFCWTAAILLALSGILMVAMGIIGYYMARIYEEVKARPRWIVGRRAGK
ncbi:MAG: glycosyltransferase family 2 protein [Clostridia bacterium]|nr:glycosyltransferase family 2 protein [Clostridia bacterium]